MSTEDGDDGVEAFHARRDELASTSLDDESGAKGLANLFAVNRALNELVLAAAEVVRRRRARDGTRVDVALQALRVTVDLRPRLLVRAKALGVAQDLIAPGKVDFGTLVAAAAKGDKSQWASVAEQLGLVWSTPFPRAGVAAPVHAEPWWRRHIEGLGWALLGAIGVVFLYPMHWTWPLAHLAAATGFPGMLYVATGRYPISALLAVGDGGQPWWRQGRWVTLVSAVVASIVPTTTALSEAVDRSYELETTRLGSYNQLLDKAIGTDLKEDARLPYLRFMTHVPAEELREWASREHELVKNHLRSETSRLSEELGEIRRKERATVQQQEQLRADIAGMELKLDNGVADKNDELLLVVELEGTADRVHELDRVLDVYRREASETLAELEAYARQLGEGDQFRDDAPAVLARRCHEGSSWACGAYGAQELESKQDKVSPVVAKVLEFACDGGVPSGCLALGKLDRRGWGGRPKSAENAAENFSRACDMGNPAGCNGYAWRLYTGDGVPEDKAAAAGLWRKACGESYASACDSLATSLVEAKVPEPVKAAEYYERACQAEFWAACENLLRLQRGPSSPPIIEPTTVVVYAGVQK